MGNKSQKHLHVEKCRFPSLVINALEDYQQWSGSATASQSVSKYQLPQRQSLVAGQAATSN